MYAIIGIVILLVLVFGGFVISGGAMGPVLHALPYEMMIIGGGRRDHRGQLARPPEGDRRRVHEDLQGPTA